MYVLTLQKRYIFSNWLFFRKKLLNIINYNFLTVKVRLVISGFPKQFNKKVYLTEVAEIEVLAFRRPRRPFLAKIEAILW